MAAPVNRGDVAALALVVALVGCGGASTRDGMQSDEAVAGSANSGSGASVGGSSAGGRNSAGEAPVGGSSAGGGNSAGGPAVQPPSPLVGVDLSHFPWFLELVHGPSGLLTFAPGHGVNVVLGGVPLQATLSTHNHLNVLGGATGITFRAKASRALPLLVSVKSTLDSDYFAARDAGNDWPVAPAPLTTEWATFEVLFSDLRPAETAEPMAEPGFTLAFVVEAESGPVELWLEDIRFF